MCGIAGAVGALDTRVAEAVRRATDRQRHRGPDDEGFWSSAEAGRGVAFGHRRLSIIDLSEGGHQPMTDPETGNVVCYNGEIYNFAALRDELEGAGAQFRSRSDTEVLLHAYGRWGERCLERLRGMFAFAIWDARRRSVLLARDRLGIKPLYLTTVTGRGGRRTALFASELRALLDGGLVPRRLDPNAVASYAWNGFVAGPETIIAGVQLLPAGCWARIGLDGEIEEQARFWELPPALPAGAVPEALAELEEALEEAVRLRLVSDVPIGIFLSGGIDSSAVCALATRASAAKVRTFNISFDDSRYDESQYAEGVSAALGTEHSDIRLTGQGFADRMEDALSSLDQPTFDAINTYFVSRAVREAGITVALSGAGGDELFGGYRSFEDIPRAARWARRLAPIPEPPLRWAARSVARLITGGQGEVPPQTRWGKLGDALATRGRLLELYQVSYALFSSEFREELLRVPLDGSVAGVPASRVAELRDAIRGQPELHAVSMLELAFFVGERLLRDTDAASMAVSLEVRVPLLDHEVVERTAALPSEVRFAALRSKRVLRDLALRELDPALFDRPKSGFVLPLDEWCRGELEEEVGAVLSDRARCEEIGFDGRAVERLWRCYRSGAPGMYWSRVWAIFVLARWARACGAAL